MIVIFLVVVFIVFITMATEVKPHAAASVSTYVSVHKRSMSRHVRTMEA